MGRKGCRFQRHLHRWPVRSEEDRIGEEGKGFGYILHSLNPERVLLGVEAIGIGQDALRRAVKYARERIVFDRQIGMNQGIQHPLAVGCIWKPPG